MNDGSGQTLSDTTFTGGLIPQEPEQPTFPGFEFLGWSATEAGPVVTFPYDHGRTSNFTLFARWKAGSYTVIYQYNGATGGASQSSTLYETDILKSGFSLPTPIRTGYTFSGWFTNLALTSPVTLQSNGKYGPTHNHTIFAKWTPINYRAIYNSVNSTSGSAPIDSRNYNIGQRISLLANSGQLVRNGYTFAGWVTSASGTGTALNSGDTVPVGSSDVNLYPKWNPNTFTISYNLNGGSGNVSGAPTSWTAGNDGVALPRTGFTRTGYDFAGWSATQGSTTPVDWEYTTFRNTELFAIWTLKSIGYSFDKGIAAGQTISNWPVDSSMSFGSTLSLPNLAGTKVTVGGAEYLFFGWNDGSSTYQSLDAYILNENSTVFTARWTKLLEVRYSFSGGTKSGSDSETTDSDAECNNAGFCAPNQAITLRAAPTRAGYSFAGWLGQDGVVRQANSPVTIRDTNHLFYAEWTPVPIEVRFEPGFDGGIVTVEQRSAGQIVTMPNPGTRTGYTFSGWSSNGGAIKLSQGSSLAVNVPAGNERLTFTALWSPNVYTIVYDWQGASGSPRANSTYTVGAGAMSLPGAGDQTKDGFVFAGWSATPGGPELSNYQPPASGVLYAKWANGNYTLTFDAQNGPTPISSALVPRGSAISLPAPTRSNFNFVGWFDELTDGNLVGVVGASITLDSSRTLYARWVQSSFYGVDEAGLETATSFIADPNQPIDTLIQHDPSGSSARVQIPAGALPTGTVISIRYFKDAYRQEQLIGEENDYFFSIVVSWLLGTGPTATVPDTLFENGVQKPITVTLSNPSIRAGVMVYQVLGGVSTPLKRATVDGSIQIEIYSDPELVVAATAPTAPRSVVAVSGKRGSSSVTWAPPASSGGSDLRNYDVLLNGTVVCAATTLMSCDFRNLADGTTYTATVIARNDIGESVASAATFRTASAPVVITPPAPVTPPQAVTPPQTVTPTPEPESPETEVPTENVTPTPEPETTEPDPSEDLGIQIPEINPGEPVANPAIGATGDDNAPPVPFDPLSSPEGVAALTSTLGEVGAVAGAIAAAGAAAAAAAGAAGGSSGSSGGSRGAPSGGGGDAGSIATIDAAHEKYKNRRRGRGDRWKIWSKRWLNFTDKPSIWLAIRSARFSPLFSKILVDGAYLRANLGSFSLLPTLFGAIVAVWSALANTADVAPPQWQWLIVIAVLGVFDAFAGFVSTNLFVVTTLLMHGAIPIEDIRLLLGVVIVGYGPALLANAFRAFRKEPESGDVYWWERIVDFVVLPFIGGWVTASMIGTLPALAGTTLAVANHVNDFAFFVALAIMARVILEEAVARYFPQRLDTLHPTDVDETDPPQKWISIAFRLAVFIFVTAALMGNVWQVWVGSALFILPTIIGFYSDKFKNFPWIWRLIPTGIPGLAFTLLVASLTTSLVGTWFGTSPDLALWSFALLPIPMLFLALLGMFGREGVEDEVRFIQRPQLKWVYRVGGIIMLLVTMNLAGVI